MEKVPTDLCYSQPFRYRFCDKDHCIPIDSACPCKEDSEFKCSLGDCIPLKFRCDGLSQCLYGEDEKLCHVKHQEPEVSGIDIQPVKMTEIPTVTVETSDEMQLSIPVVVTITSFCVFFGVLLIIILCIFIARRQKNNTSRESQSATEPLRKSYITSDLETADVLNESGATYKQTTFTSRKPAIPERLHYLPVETTGNCSDYNLSNYQTDKCGNEDRLEQPQSDGIENVYDKCTENMAIIHGVEIYNTDPPDSSRVSGLGKYTFKPRLKYLTSKPYFEIEEKDREKLYVINSYKHCSGKSILPSTLTFDKDPEKFSDKFATDLLCSSTPRQGAKHLENTERSRSKDSLTGQDDKDLDL